MRHINTHRTPSIGYAIVLDGEIDMLMDDIEVHAREPAAWKKRWTQ